MIIFCLYLCSFFPFLKFIFNDYKESLASVQNSDRLIWSISNLLTQRYKRKENCMKLWIICFSFFSISGLHKKYTFVITWTLSQRLHKKQEQTDTKNRLAVSALSNSWLNRLAVSALSNSWLSPSTQPVSFTFSCAAQYSEWPRSNINILRNKWTITTKFHTHTQTFWKQQKQKMCLRLFMPLSCSGFWRHKGLKFCFVLHQAFKIHTQKTNWKKKLSQE